MRIILFTLLLITSLDVYGQLNISLTGNPVNTAGWTFPNGVSYVQDSTIVLTDPVGGQAGYIYDTIPQNITNCAIFTIDFDFRVTQPSDPVADGISMWCISNPPNNYTSGSGLGLPNNPNGLMLLFDDFENSGTYTFPLVSMRQYNGTQNYDDGNAIGVIGTQLQAQNWVADGAWHHVVFDYNQGNINVYFDNNATAAISGFYSLSQSVYFGFSASTGSDVSKQAIKDVHIVGNFPAPPATDTLITYCQYDTATALSATGTNIKWYTVDTGGIALPGAPTPNTAIADTMIWYVSQTAPPCSTEGVRVPVRVIVHPQPLPPAISNNDQVYCYNDTFKAFTVTGQSLLWYAMDTGGTGDAKAPLINTSLPGADTFYVSQTSAYGCESKRTAAIAFVDQLITINAGADTSVCSGSLIQLQGTASNIDSTISTYTYQWTPADQLSAPNSLHTYYKADSTALLKLTATSSKGCTYADSMTVHVPPPHFLTVSNDTAICSGDSVQLQASGAVSYVWSPANYLSDTAIADPIARPLADITYRVLGLDTIGCVDSGFITLRRFPNAVIDLPDSVTIYPGESYQMSPGGNCLYYSWFPPSGLTAADIANPIANPEVNTRYIIHASTEAGCTIVDSIDVYTGGTLLAVPNAFTPGAGANNVLKVIKRGEATLKQFQVFNRWGNKVFETENIDEGWDGTFKGSPQPVGVYIYRVEAYTNTGQRFYKQGNVTLLK